MFLNGVLDIIHRRRKLSEQLFEEPSFELRSLSKAWALLRVPEDISIVSPVLELKGIKAANQGPCFIDGTRAVPEKNAVPLHRLFHLEHVGLKAFNLRSKLLQRHRLTL